MERAQRQQSNHDYWEQAQRLRPLDVAARAEMLAAEDKAAEAYAEFERGLQEVAVRYGNPSPQLELTRRRFIAFCWSQRDYARIYELSMANLRCKEARYGNLHPSLQARLGELAGACYFLGRHEESENFARQMLAIAIMQPQPWKHRGDHALNYIATFLAARGDHATAIDYLKQALLWAEKGNYSGWFDIERYADKLANSYESLGRLKEASEVLTKYQPRKPTFAERDLVMVFRFFWRLFNLDLRIRKPEDRFLDSGIAYIGTALPKVGLRGDNREIYFLFEMMKARLLKLRGKQQEAREAYGKIIETFRQGEPLPEGKLSWAYSDLADLWQGPPLSGEERANLRLALECMEAAGVARGSAYARLLSRLGCWHHSSDIGTYLDCHRKAVAALKEGEDPPLLANLHWHISQGEVEKFGYAWLRVVRDKWRALPPGHKPDKGFEVFLRWRESFQRTYRRHVVSLGPRHPDTLRVLDFIQKHLS